MPRVRLSIVTPSYNHAAFLQEAIESVLSQEYPALEYCVYDGGSTDGSADIIRRYAPRLAYWQSRPDAGQTAAIVAGWQRATGDVLAWLNSDDFYPPGGLARVAAAFAADPRPDVVIGSCLIADEGGRIIGNKYARGFDVPAMLTTSGGVPGQPAVFVHRRVLERVGLPDPALHYVMDWEYWIRLGLALAPDRVRVIYEPLAVVRAWPGTKTLTGIEAICDEHRQVLAKLFAGGTLPSHLQLLKDESLAGTYIKQSYLQWQVGRGADARRSLAQARALGPASKGNRLRGAWLWARTLLPHWVYDSWQRRGRR